MFDNIYTFIKLKIKILTGEKKSFWAIWKLISTTIGCVSSFFSFAVLLEDFVSYNKLKIWTKSNSVLVIIIGIFISLFIHRRKTYSCIKDSNSDMSFDMNVTDIFSNSDASCFVIPTNTYFRTKLEGEYISPDSVQGRFQLKYFGNDIDGMLDKLISESLNSQGISYTNDVDCYGNVKKYPVGTVAKIDYKGKHYYFVAINDVNKNGTPINQNINNIDIALKGIFDALITNGHCGVLCIPLIGSGRASIHEATKEEVFKRIIDFFITSNYKIAKKIIISISPKDYIENRIDFDRFEKYLDYKCEFR